jgi:hypothetical protein
MRARRTDTTHREVLRAIKLLGFPYRDLSGVGKGVEDILVGIPGKKRDKWEPLTPYNHGHDAFWLMVEVKTIERESTGYVRYTKAQEEWAAQTGDFPRVTLTGFEDALAKLREMAGR